MYVSRAVDVVRLLAVGAIFAVSFCCSACSRAGGSAILTAREFTKEAALALRASAPTDVTIDMRKDLDITLASEKRGQIVCDLTRTYAEYRGNPAGKTAIIQQWVAANLELLSAGDKQVKADDIIPLVRSRAYLANTAEALSAQGVHGSADFVYDDLNADLIILYAENTGHAFHFIHPSDVQGLKIDRKDLRPLAVKNLRRAIPKIMCAGGKGVNVFATGGDLESSLLVLDDFWDKKAMNVQGDIVVAVPTWDCLVVTGSEDAGGLAAVRKIAADTYAKSAHQLTPKLFVLRDGRFVEFKEGAEASRQSR